MPETELVVYRVKDGQLTSDEVHEGDIITDFKEAQWIFLSILSDGGSHKIYARKPGLQHDRSHRLFFPSVFGLIVMRAGMEVR